MAFSVEQGEVDKGLVHLLISQFGPGFCMPPLWYLGFQFEMWKQSANRQVSIVAAAEGTIKSIPVKYTQTKLLLPTKEKKSLFGEKDKRSANTAGERVSSCYYSCLQIITMPKIILQM